MEWHTPLVYLPSHGEIQLGTRALTYNHHAAKTPSALKIKASKRKKKLEKTQRIKFLQAALPTALDESERKKE